uniref:Inositol polyphosphate-related phosphatase domain-containing protein n=1 Tax=Chrysotila carterae TaxID=13221 RepID=A0A7S4BAJ1_CHRCT
MLPLAPAPPRAKLVGLLLLVLVRPSAASAVTHVFADSVKTGFGGAAGNKGAVAVRLGLFGCELCVINAHLPAGHSHADERNADHAEVLRGLRTSFAAARHGPFCGPLEHDLCVWLGDLNYRLELPNDEVRARISKGNWKSLHQFDQLLMAQASCQAFVGFQEGELSFQPTYKYDAGTNRYDTSEKQRVPSWCDRVLWSGSDAASVALEAYLSCQAVLVSDHKPVAALLSWSPRAPVSPEPPARSRMESIGSVSDSPSMPNEATSVGELIDFDDLISDQRDAAFSMPANAPLRASTAAAAAATDISVGAVTPTAYDDDDDAAAADAAALDDLFSMPMVSTHDSSLSADLCEPEAAADAKAWEPSDFFSTFSGESAAVTSTTQGATTMDELCASLELVFNSTTTPAAPQSAANVPDLQLFSGAYSAPSAQTSSAGNCCGIPYHATTAPLSAHDAEAILVPEKQLKERLLSKKGDGAAGSNDTFADLGIGMLLADANKRA